MREENISHINNKRKRAERAEKEARDVALVEWSDYASPTIMDQKCNESGLLEHT